MRVVVEDLVVDLVGDDNEIMLASEVDDFLEQFPGVDSSGRVVWIEFGWLLEREPNRYATA